MMYAHSVGRSVRYYAARPALRTTECRLSFHELHDRVRNLAAALNRVGFQPGDRLALLLPNGPEYIQLVYACSWLGVIVVPINTRLSAAEIDHVLSDACPRGLVRHSSLPIPSTPVSWTFVLDKEPLEGQSDSCPDIRYEPDAVLALTTGAARRVDRRA